MDLFKKIKAEKKKSKETLNSKESQLIERKKQLEKLQEKESQFTKLLLEGVNSTIYDNSFLGDIDVYKVPKSQTSYYLKDWISEEQGSLLYSIITSQDKDRWVHLAKSGRSLQKWGGDVLQGGLTNLEKIPCWLDCLSQRMLNQNIIESEFYPNHFLINHYKGDIGIMPHTDGPLYHPFVTVVSLGSPIIFRIYQNYEGYHQENEISNILIEDRSLFIFTDDYYQKFLHCIRESEYEVINLRFKIETIDASPINRYNLVKQDDCEILNLDQSSLYSNIIQPYIKEVNQVIQEVDHLNKNTLIELLNQVKENSGKGDIYRYEWVSPHPTDDDILKNGDLVNLKIGWDRKERISLTIRNVKLADQQT